MTAALQLDLLKGKRQRGVKPPDASEFEIHCLVADTLCRWRNKGWWASHIPSGEKRDAITAGRLQRLGVRPGMSDFLVLGPGFVGFLELKRRTGKLSPAQSLFRDAVIASGAAYAQANSFKDAINQLRAWGAVRATVSA